MAAVPPFGLTAPVLVALADLELITVRGRGGTTNVVLVVLLVVLHVLVVLLLMVLLMVLLLMVLLMVLLMAATVLVLRSRLSGTNKQGPHEGDTETETFHRELLYIEGLK